MVKYLNLTFFHKVVQKDNKKLSLKTVNVALIRKQKSRVQFVPYKIKVYQFIHKRNESR